MASFEQLSRSGNLVADYNWRTEKCQECCGGGTIAKDRIEFLDYMEGKRGQKFRKLMKIYRRWKKFGEVECPECEGSGEYYEEY